MCIEAKTPFSISIGDIFLFFYNIYSSGANRKRLREASNECPQHMSRREICLVEKCDRLSWNLYCLELDFE